MTTDSVNPTERCPVGSFRWQPEDDEGEGGEEDAGQSEEVAGEHRLSLEVDLERQRELTGSLRNRALRLDAGHVPATALAEVLLEGGDVEAARIELEDDLVAHVRPGGEHQMAALVVERKVAHIGGARAVEDLVGHPRDVPVVLYDQKVVADLEFRNGGVDQHDVRYPNIILMYPNLVYAIIVSCIPSQVFVLPVHFDPHAGHQHLVLFVQFQLDETEAEYDDGGGRSVVHGSASLSQGRIEVQQGLRQQLLLRNVLSPIDGAWRCDVEFF